ncbi:hypothetical protein PHISP_01093 [Aspergillus sp. HF37]|nr:hypothetical protein PHISP_01093 [Aspergillus sp. HF37]
MSSSQPPQAGGNHAPTGKPFSMSLSSSSTANGASKKPTSFNLQPSSRPAPDSSNRNLPRRPHQLHHDSEDEDDETPPTHEAVTGFDTQTGTTILAQPKPEQRDLVIPVASGNNWRDRPGVNVRRGKKNLLPREVQALQEAKARGEDVTGESETDKPGMRYGISYAESRGEIEGDKEMHDATPLVPPVIDEQRPLTQDEIALRELVRESKGETEGRSDLVIQASKPAGEEEEEEDSGLQYDETSSFRADIASRPEPASLDQYNAIPVEDFGAALLRGMGWKEGQAVGRGNYDTSATAKKSTTPRVPERRPGFLGIGAKDLSGGKGAESEIGAWGKAAMRKGSRKSGAKEGGDGNTEGVYMPILMRNRQTGEYITEDDLAAARKDTKGKRDDDSWKERRDRNLERSGRDRDREYRRRDYEDSDDYDRRRTGSSRRDRSLSAGDRHSRSRRHDDDDYSSGRDDRSRRGDRERRRDRDRDRDRDSDRDRSRRYRDDDRYSSRHSSSHSSRHRDRDRDRDDRDSYRRRHDR